jgi:hypothetical protein
MGIKNAESDADLEFVVNIEKKVRPKKCVGRIFLRAVKSKNPNFHHFFADNLFCMHIFAPF